MLRSSSNVSVQCQAIGSVDDDIGVMANLVEPPLVVVGVGNQIPHEWVGMGCSNLGHIDVPIKSFVSSVGNKVEPVSLNVLYIPLVVLGRRNGGPQEGPWVSSSELRSSSSVAIQSSVSSNVYNCVGSVVDGHFWVVVTCRSEERRVGKECRN